MKQNDKSKGTVQLACLGTSSAKKCSSKDLVRSVCPALRFPDAPYGSVSAASSSPAIGDRSAGRKPNWGILRDAGDRSAACREYRRNGCRSIRSHSRRRPSAAYARKSIYRSRSNVGRRWAILFCQRRSRVLSTHDHIGGSRDPSNLRNPASRGGLRCPSGHVAPCDPDGAGNGRAFARRASGRANQRSRKATRAGHHSKFLCQLRPQCSRSYAETKVRTRLEIVHRSVHICGSWRTCGD